ncbi:MAG: hypothetical protein H0U87_08835 [Acidobacteria bacterium]|nr:hypothetical protein [Acidobacteriota bacterium]
MTERQTTKAGDSMRLWLPCFIGGLCAPMFGNFLNVWLPLHFAVGVAFFVVWLIVGLILSRMSPNPKRSFAGLIGSAVLGAAVAGTIAFFFPWK